MSARWAPAYPRGSNACWLLSVVIAIASGFVAVPRDVHVQDRLPARVQVRGLIINKPAVKTMVTMAVWRGMSTRPATQPRQCPGGCGWTLQYSCPGQPRGSKSVAGDDGSEGYRCCCGSDQGWRSVSAPPTVPPQMSHRPGNCSTVPMTCTCQGISDLHTTYADGGSLRAGSAAPPEMSFWKKTVAQPSPESIFS